MEKSSVIISYSKLSDADLDNFSQVVYNALNGNANFTFATTILPALLTKCTTYKGKVEAAYSNNPKDIAAKNAAKADLLDTLRSMAVSVNQQANGDLIKLKSSGFVLAKTPSPRGVLPKPTGFSVKSGNNSGDLLFTVDALKEATMYFFYSATVPAPEKMTEWRLTPSTARKINVSGFVPGKQYAVCCAYKGSEELLVYSDKILIFAQ